MKKYNIGDIVFVSDVENPKNEGAKFHYFVIIDEDQSIIDVSLYGFLISSQINKNKNKSRYKYNELITKSKKNGLKTDGHVKCDTLYSFSKWNVIIKVGEVELEDFLRFISAYRNYLEETSEKEDALN